MPCPYAEKRGVVVYCKAIGKPVNPLAYPCLTERYRTCRFYLEAEARKAAARREARQPAEAAGAGATIPQRPRVVEAPRQVIETRGLTVDGKPARNCLECVFYSDASKLCLLLGVKVEDPNNPPCARG